MHRPLLLIVTLWALFGAPVLCAAGVLAHACACDEGVACDHEEDCHSDPCSDQVVRRDPGPESRIADAGHDAPLSLPVSVSIASPPPAPPAPPRSARIPIRPLGVRHRSDLPLLI